MSFVVCFFIIMEERITTAATTVTLVSPVALDALDALHHGVERRGKNVRRMLDTTGTNSFKRTAGQSLRTFIHHAKRTIPNRWSGGYRVAIDIRRFVHDAGTSHSACSIANQPPS
jgi:hypothetical protein